jgi:hypothetical protein
VKTLSGHAPLGADMTFFYSIIRLALIASSPTSTVVSSGPENNFAKLSPISRLLKTGVTGRTTVTPKNTLALASIQLSFKSLTRQPTDSK